MCVWLLREHRQSSVHRSSMFDRFRSGYEWLLSGCVELRWLVLLVTGDLRGGVCDNCTSTGQEIFPTVDAGSFGCACEPPMERTSRNPKRLPNKRWNRARRLGEDAIELSVGYVGMVHSNFPVNAVYQWSRGPEEAILYVDLKDDIGISDVQVKERIRQRLAKELPEVRFSFEPSDIINEIMSFGSPTPIEVVVSGTDFAKSREFTDKIRAELAKIATLRDLQVGQSMDYPTVQVNVDRERPAWLA